MTSKTLVANHKAKKRFECNTCSYTCIRKFEMTMHLLVHNREKPFSCKVCEARFTQASSLKRHHLRVHTKEKNFQCCQCDYAGATKDNLTAHMMIHRKVKLFSCAECKKVYSTGAQLNKHQFVAHAKQKRLKCSSCDYTCAWPSTLKTHQLVHSRRKSIKCSDCGKWFFRQSHLKRHKLIVHSVVEKLKCPHCKYSCAVREMLEAHLLNHTAKNKHKCGKCESAFTTPGRLKRHNFMVHVKEKRYKCSFCSYSCSFKRSLEKHVNNHVDNSGKGFEIPDLNHQLSGQVEKKVLIVDSEVLIFKCTVCHSTFDNKPRLELHMKQHTGSTSFSCSICGSTFRVKTSLKKHVSKLHSEKN